MIKIIVIIFGVVFGLAACLLAAVALAFGYFKDATGKATATITDTKHRKNVRINCGRYSHGRDTFVKDITVAVYLYNVGDRTYRVKHTYYNTTPRQADRIVRVVYIRCFPRISHVDSPIASAPFTYGLTASLFALFSVILLAMGIAAPMV